MTQAAYELGTCTDPGRDPEKQVNEDAQVDADTPFGHVFVVCDGMGGHVGGREASTRACAQIVETMSAEPATTPPRDALKNAVKAANEAVFKLRVQEVGHGHPGSTVVALLMHAGGVEVAHVGDSRIYFVHHGQVQQVTRDHSKVQLLIDIGAIRPEDAKAHPETHQIFAALGISEQVDVDMKAPTFVYVEGDTFILCSDGLCDLVEAHEIRDIVVASPPRVAAEQLVALANDRGGHDNITVSVVRANVSANMRQTTTTLVDGLPPLPVPGPGDVTEPMRTQVMASQSPPAAASSSRTQVYATPAAGSGPQLPDASAHPAAPAPRKRIDALFVFSLFAALLVGSFLMFVAMRARHVIRHRHDGEADASVTSAPLVPTTTDAPIINGGSAGSGGPPAATNVPGSADSAIVPIIMPSSSHNPFLEALPSATNTAVVPMPSSSQRIKAPRPVPEPH